MAKVATTQIAKSDAGGAAAMPDAHGQGRLDIAPTLQRAERAGSLRGAQ
jgi:hypothetical protein